MIIKLLFIYLFVYQDIYSAEVLIDVQDDEFEKPSGDIKNIETDAPTLLNYFGMWMTPLTVLQTVLQIRKLLNLSSFDINEPWANKINELRVNAVFRYS